MCGGREVRKRGGVGEVDVAGVSAGKLRGQGLWSCGGQSGASGCGDVWCWCFCCEWVWE